MTAIGVIARWPAAGTTQDHGTRTRIDIDVHMLAQAQAAADARGMTLNELIWAAVAQYLVHLRHDADHADDLTAAGSRAGRSLTTAKLRLMLDDDDAKQVRLACR
jgi:hypothetical protein